MSPFEVLITANNPFFPLIDSIFFPFELQDPFITIKATNKNVKIIFFIFILIPLVI